MTPAPLGAIADDYTGATDVAVAFRRSGLRTALAFGVPPAGMTLPPHDALVIGLKSRTIDPAAAVAQSREALQALKANGVDQVYFKYCSTFDSTATGNIGPVLDALADDLGAERVVTTPSSPEHRRTVYHGQLFVDGQLLAESPMRHHPLTPMTRSFVPGLLAAQSRHKVELLLLPAVREGAHSLSASIARMPGDVRYLVADAIEDDDLAVLAESAAASPLVAGAAGLAAAVARVRARITALEPERLHADEPDMRSPTVVLSGSCSRRTLEQLAALEEAGRPMYRIDPVSHPHAGGLADLALAWWESVAAGPAAVIYSSLPPDRLAEVQSALGVARSAEILEDAMARIARGLSDRGVRSIISAGGETSGAVVSALGISVVTLGREVARGVPWVYSAGERPMALLLKSGNFGDSDFLVTASAGSTKNAGPE